MHTWCSLGWCVFSSDSFAWSWVRSTVPAPLLNVCDGGSSCRRRSCLISASFSSTRYTLPATADDPYTFDDSRPSLPAAPCHNVAHGNPGRYLSWSSADQEWLASGAMPWMPFGGPIYNLWLRWGGEKLDEASGCFELLEAPRSYCPGAYANGVRRSHGWLLKLLDSGATMA